jgi:hypothetical protein
MLDPYLAEVAARLRAIFGAELVGVYVGGSYALGDYAEGRSDVDVAAVAQLPTSRGRKDAVVAALRHESLPCPARGLEFVLYDATAAGTPSTDAAFDLNLNTGARMDFRVDYDPSAIEAHWFPIDRTILAQHGVALAGPPASDVFAPLPREDVLPILRESLRWHELGAASDDAVLNACRAWRYAADGTWSSKPAAGAWALERGAGDVVADALAARSGNGPVDPEQAAAFVRSVVQRLA